MPLATAVIVNVLEWDAGHSVPPPGLEPGHMASEANALSAELRGQNLGTNGPYTWGCWLLSSLASVAPTIRMC